MFAAINLSMNIYQHFHFSSAWACVMYKYLPASQQIKEMHHSAREDEQPGALVLSHLSDIGFIPLFLPAFLLWWQRAAFSPQPWATTGVKSSAAAAMQRWGLLCKVELRDTHKLCHPPHTHTQTHTCMHRLPMEAFSLFEVALGICNGLWKLKIVMSQR